MEALVTPLLLRRAVAVGLASDIPRQIIWRPSELIWKYQQAVFRLASFDRFFSSNERLMNDNLRVVLCYPARRTKITCSAFLETWREPIGSYSFPADRSWCVRAVRRDSTWSILQHWNVWATTVQSNWTNAEKFLLIKKWGSPRGIKNKRSPKTKSKAAQISTG
jgi:hypothetical protein